MFRCVFNVIVWVLFNRLVTALALRSGGPSTHWKEKQSSRLELLFSYIITQVTKSSAIFLHQPLASKSHYGNRTWNSLLKLKHPWSPLFLPEPLGIWEMGNGERVPVAMAMVSAMAPQTYAADWEVGNGLADWLDHGDLQTDWILGWIDVRNLIECKCIFVSLFGVTCSLHSEPHLQFPMSSSLCSVRSQESRVSSSQRPKMLECPNALMPLTPLMPLPLSVLCKFSL